MNHKTLHISVGLATLAIFLASGAYMIMNFPDAYASDEIIRYQFRANHIYILMSALLNLVAGLYVRPTYSGWRLTASTISTALLLLAPILLVIAFFSEPIRGVEARPITFFGVLALLLGTLSAHLPNIAFGRAHKQRAGELGRGPTHEPGTPI